MPLLEIIACTLQDAVEAERGGADRIEVVSHLEIGGLAPSMELVQAVLSAVRIPVRVMLRDHEGFGRPRNFEALAATVRNLGGTDVSGVVMGFANEGALDLDSVRDLLVEAPQLRVTIHRVFDNLRDRISAIEQMKAIPQIDRILTAKGPWNALARAAAPQIAIVAGGGMQERDYLEISRKTSVREFHSGRAVREPQTVEGNVSAERVRKLKQLLRD